MILNDKEMKAQMDYLKHRIEMLEKKKQPTPEYKECETCHGLFAKYVTGESEIRERPKKIPQGLLCYYVGDPLMEEYIHNPIYCERCAIEHASKKKP